MGTMRLTNWLLLGILLALLAHLGMRFDQGVAMAETFQLDRCITSLSQERPEAYLHVVTHRFAGP